MRSLRTALILGLSVSITGSSLVAQGGTSGPKARYHMDIGTLSGMAAMGGGMGGGLSMMFGGGRDKEVRELQLRLGSTQTPSKGGPKADHYFLPQAKLGKSVPLVTPDRTPPGTAPFERPKGRLILFWGCGAKAPKGQPVILDFSKLAAGQIPPGLFSSRVPEDRGPTFGNSRTYGDWPRAKGSKPPGAGSSLIGEHRIAGNYSPEMKFSLSQDYMPGFTGRSSALPGGATALTWSSVAGATGFHAWAMGFKSDGKDEPTDYVWWSSSASRDFGGGLWDWLPPATVKRLIGEKVVMPPTQTSCTVPAEVKNYAPDFQMGTIYAYGPEENFAFPPKPATGPWNIEWTAKARYRSMTSWFITSPAGMPGSAATEAPEQKRCKPSVFGVLTGSRC